MQNFFKRNKHIHGVIYALNSQQKGKEIGVGKTGIRVEVGTYLE